MIREDYIKALDNEFKKINNKDTDYYKGYKEAIEMAKRQFNIAFTETFLDENDEDCNYCSGDVDSRDYLLSNGSEDVYIDNPSHAHSLLQL